MTIEFRLLGDVAADADGRLVAVGHLRQRCVLVALLVDANRVVPVDQLVDRVWGEHAPQRARGTLRSYVSRLRQVLCAAGVAISRRPGGYVLTVDPMFVDLHRFDHLIGQARATNDDEAAVALVTQALELWCGEPFAGLDTPWFNTARENLQRRRMMALLDRFDLALRCGDHVAVLPDLFTAAAENPMDERLAGQLMVALYRCGRQADALETYRRMRLRLADELGADPGPALQLVYRQILTADDTLATPARTVAASNRGSARGPVPRQLPAPPRSFTGRRVELAELNKLMDDQPDRGATMLIWAIGGTGGVGKTWLGLRWAHDNLERFPDGQLYIDMRGFDPASEPLSPEVAVRGFLDALGVPPAAVPTEPDAQVGLYRSLVAGKRMLVVVDNARDTTQVAPLLPGAPTCTVLITSRRQLTSLVTAHGARPMPLDVLTATEAHQLLTEQLGADRVAAEPEPVRALIRWCAGLPLALGIIATRAAIHPELPLAELAGELLEASTRLDALDAGELAVNLRAVLACSCRALSPEAARLFGLLGLAPGADIGVAATASLSGLPAASVRLRLRELTTAHLLQDQAGRHRMHDLVRLYAIEQAHILHSEDERRAAVRRVLGHYLHTAHAADALLGPHREPVNLMPIEPAVRPERIAHYQHAMAWFAAEHSVLLAAVAQAAATGFDTHASQLARVLATFLDRRGHWHDLAATQRVARDAAERAADPTGRAMAHAGLGRADSMRGRYAAAAEHFGHALEIFGQLGDRVGQAQAHIDLVRVFERQVRHREALSNAYQALDLYRAADHRIGQAGALNAIGWIHVQLGEHRRALAYCQRSLDLYRAIGDSRGQANAWDSLGYAHHHLGRYDEAIVCYRHAFDRVHELGDEYQEADVLTHLANTHLAAGNPEPARRAWRRALAILDRLGHPDADDVRAKLNADVAREPAYYGH
jgi:DNA-binding SARP family transcriptional activator/tetratricopeptide (TPR) repeat protein